VLKGKTATSEYNGTYWATNSTVYTANIALQLLVLLLCVHTVPDSGIGTETTIPNFCSWLSSVTPKNAGKYLGPDENCSLFS